MRADRLRLLDALEQIELIRRFSEPGRDVFFGDVLTQSAILHRLARLGEACRGLSPEVREVHAEIPWNQIIAFSQRGHPPIQHGASLGASLDSALHSLPD